MRLLCLSPILMSILIYSSCSEKQTPNTSQSLNTSKSDQTKKRLLEDKSDEEIKASLAKAKRHLSRLSEESEFRFEGSQAKLDDALKAWSALYDEHTYSITWIPENSKSDKQLKGVIKVTSSPESIALCHEFIEVCEAELEYRKNLE